MEPKPTYTTDDDVQFYVKATSNCEPLPLTTLHALFGGDWSASADDLPDSQLLTDWRAAGERLATDDDDDLPPELDFDDLAAIARAWPWNVKDALGRFVSHAMQQAGIDDKRKRLAVQAELLRLLEE